MKRYIFASALLSLALGVSAQEAATDSIEEVGFKFTDVKTVKSTSIKDQNRTGTCWCFSGTSFFEDDIIRQGGDSLDISEMFTVRNCYLDKARQYIRNYGRFGLTPGGQIHDVAYSFEKYGIVPEEAYTGLQYGFDKHDHGELNGVIEAYLKVIAQKPMKKLSTAWFRGLEGILDAYLGEVPETFTYKGKTYTPQQFAKVLGFSPANYVSVTSFTHHPFYEEFAIEIPDNWLNIPAMNLPMEDMKAIVDNAVENGFPVAWAADISESGFKWYDGVALMPAEKTAEGLEGTELARWVKLSDREKERERYEFTGPVDEIEVTQELRQQMYDNQETTDDHGMEIVGYATDQNGKRYYKVRNSWGTSQKYDGFLYVSEPFFLAKTINVYVHKDAVPAAIAKKMGLKK